MIIENIPPFSVDWKKIPVEKVNGETGFSKVKTQTLGNIKLREVEYSPNYKADHWCDKGHVLYVIEGELTIEHIDNTMHSLKSGMTYLIGDDTLSHKVKSNDGAKVLIVD